MTDRSFFLKLAAVGLGLVGLGYGVAPGSVMGPLLEVDFGSVDQLHIFRGVMGIYLGMAGFWFFSASKKEYDGAAVASVVFFMFGLAAARVLSILIDGPPSPMLVGAILVEAGVGAWGLAVLRRTS